MWSSSLRVHTCPLTTSLTCRLRLRWLRRRPVMTASSSFSLILPIFGCTDCDQERG